MATKSNKPASRGFVNNIILESLLNGDKYGYEIIKEVEDRSNGTIILKQPSLYSSLKRFEARGFITSYWGDSDIGGRRHYYTITEVGRKYYNAQMSGEKFSLEDFESNDNDDVDAQQLSINNLESAQESINVESEDYDVFELLEANVEPIPTPVVTPTPQRIERKEFAPQTQKMFTQPERKLETSVEENKVEHKVEEKPIEEKPQIAEPTKDTTLNILGQAVLTIKPMPIFDEPVNNQPEIEKEEVNDFAIKEEDDDDIFNEDLEEDDDVLEVDDEEDVETEIDIEEITEEVNKNIERNKELLEKSLRMLNLRKDVDAEFGVQSSMFAKEDNLTNDILNKQKVNKEELDELKKQYTEHPTKQDQPVERKLIPLIKEREQEYFNWEDLKRKVVLNTQSEAQKLNTIETEEKVQDSPTPTQQLHTELGIVKPRVVKDEFGILHDADTIKPKTGKVIIDNVVVRVQRKDPLLITKEKKAEQQKQEEVLNSVKPQIDDEVGVVKNFEEEQRKISEKLLRAFEMKAKSKEVDLKNIMGDIIVSDEEVDALIAAEKSEQLSKQTTEVEFEPTEDYSIPNNDTKIKASSYTALQDNLARHGFTFKPYTLEIPTKEKPTDFILANRVKFHLGIIMLLLALVQITAFAVALRYIAYEFKLIDTILMGVAMLINLVIFISLWLPFIFNPKKRKLYKSEVGSNTLFGFLSFVGIGVLTYAINSLFGLVPSNFNEYIVTLFLPLIVAFNLVIAPLVLHVLSNSRKYY